MALDCTYSYLTGLLDKAEWQQIIQTLKELGFELYVPELDAEDSIFQGLTEFREHLGGHLAIMLLQSIGKGIEVGQVNLSIYKRAIVMLQNL